MTAGDPSRIGRVLDTIIKGQQSDLERLPSDPGQLSAFTTERWIVFVRFMGIIYGRPRIIFSGRAVYEFASLPLHPDPACLCLAASDRVGDPERAERRERA
jgi:hypothetical protein